MAFAQKNQVQSPSEQQTETLPKTFSLVPWIDLIVLLGVGYFFCVYMIGVGSFANGDQTDHVLVVQNMHQTGNWLHPSNGYKFYFNKPPLKMWLSLIPVAIFGETNFAFRLIDGLCGIGMGLMVFYFARSLFNSRGAAYLSMFALYGCHLFFFGHGVRNAVQDSMMNFFVTLSLISAWRYVGDIQNTEKSKLERSTGILQSGLYVGLAALCKALGAYISWIVLGAYLLLSGGITKVVWRYAIIAGLLSVIPLAAYIAAQGENADNMLKMMLISEGLKRAVKGYHHVHRSWYYWKTILDGSTVPVVLLVTGVIYGTYRWLREKDQRFLYLLCWALVPVIFYQCLRSKLTWYICPALPAMSILVGITLWTALSVLGKSGSQFVTERIVLRQFGRASRRQSREPQTKSQLLLTIAKNLGLAGFCIYGLVALVLNAKTVMDTVFIATKKSATDLIVQDLIKYQQTSGKKLNVASLYASALAKHEQLYFNSLQITRYPVEQENVVRELLAQGKIDVLLTDPANFAELSEIRPVEAYAFLPAKFRRRRWLAVLSYIPGVIPRTTTPALRRYDFSDHVPTLLQGWRPEAAVLHDVTLRASRGRRSYIRLKGDSAMKQVTTELELSLAANVNTKDAALDVDVYLNETRVGTLENLQEGFNKRLVRIAPDQWVTGDNQISFVYRFRDGREISENAQLVFFDELIVRVPARAEAKLTADSPART